MKAGLYKKVTLADFRSQTVHPTQEFSLLRTGTFCHITFQGLPVHMIGGSAGSDYAFIKKHKNKKNTFNSFTMLTFWPVSGFQVSLLGKLNITLVFSVVYKTWVEPRM